MDAIVCRSVVKSFGNFKAVKNVDLTIPKGQCFGLLGPNGAGKSTLISLIYGALLRTEGEINVLGFDPQTQAQELRARLGVVTQENHLDMSLTVEENMAMYCTFQGVEKSKRKERIENLLEFMLLSHKKDAIIESLSGGMKRRLVFVRALLNSPDLVILDEPTTGLDPAVRQLLWEKINEIRSRGTTVLLTTHYMDEAERLCDQLVIMDEGKIIEQGTPKALIAKYCATYVAGIEKTAQMKDIPSEIEVFKDQHSTLLWSQSLEKLSVFLAKNNVTPQFIRPSNLEDVFLKITGKELSEND
jgi:lipooligosaccharide transport system ATP-binding protein